MKILIANHHLEYRAGSELHTVDLCRGFRRAGHQVVVFTLKPGVVADVLKDEGFSVLSLPDLASLGTEDFDLVYLHHATCEVVLGLIFVGKVPIVRGYLGIVPPLEKPIMKDDFLSGEVYVSELVEGVCAEYHPGVPSMVARNVYDDRQVRLGAALVGPPTGRPNFAVVSNHLSPALVGSLEAAASDGLCRFTHFGLPHNNVSVTTELLAPFDAVITVGRTVLVAAAWGKPVYICDINGADGWLTRENLDKSQSRNFSGRMFAIEDWGLIRQQLLDTSRWPKQDDLTWICERVRKDHSLSRRIEQLEAFFGEVLQKTLPAAPTTDGYQAVLQFLEERERDLIALRSEKRKLVDASSEVRARAEAQTLRSHQLGLKVQRLNGHVKELAVRNRKLASRTQNLHRQLEDLRNSTTWKVLTRVGRLRTVLLGNQRTTK